MQCLKWYAEQSVEDMGLGGFICETAEETFAQAHATMAARECLDKCQDIEVIFNGHNMLEPLEVPEDGTQI